MDKKKDINTDAAEEEISFDLNMPKDDDGDKIINSKNKLRIIVYVIVFSALAALIAYLAFCFALRSPKNTVAAALKNTVEELGCTAEISKGEALRDFLLSSPSESFISVTYKGGKTGNGSSLKRLFGSGFSANIKYDPTEKRASGDIAANIGNMPVNVLEFLADNKSFYGRAPLIESLWLEIPFENIFSSYNSSVLSGYMGRFDFTQDFSADIFDTTPLKDMKSVRRLLTDYFCSHNTMAEKLWENAYVTKTDEGFETENGRKAKGYCITLKGSDLSELSEDIKNHIKNGQSFMPLAHSILPIAKVLTKNPLMTEEGLCSLIEAGQPDIMPYFDPNKDYDVMVYVYRKKIIKAEGVFDMPLPESYETAAIRLSLAFPSGRELKDKAVFEADAVEKNKAALKTEITNDGTTSRLSAHGSFRFLGAPYSVSAEGEYSVDTSQYSLDVNVKNDDHPSDMAELSSEGMFSMTENSLCFSAESLNIDATGQKPLSADIWLETNPLEGSAGAAPEISKKLFTPNEDEFDIILDEIKKGCGSLAAMMQLIGG